MANRLLAYRVALEMERRRGRGGRRPSYRLTDVADRLLSCVVRRQQAGGDTARGLAATTDYQLAVCAGVSVRQTAELYEEVGLGFLVREALDRLEGSGLLRVSRKAASGPYVGFTATAQGLAAVDVRPWYQRLLGFFDPPPGERSDPT